MDNPILYGHFLSGHSYKVALFLSLSGIEYTYRLVDISRPRPERPDEFRAVSAYGEVPVFIDGPTTICQSDAILTYIAEHVPDVTTADPRQRWTDLQWLFWEANRIGFSVSNLRFALRFKSDPDADEVALLRTRAIADLDRLQNELTDKPYLTRDTPSIADIACCGYLYWLNEAQLDVSNWPKIEQWLDRIAQQPGWFHPDQMPKKSGHIRATL